MALNPGVCPKLARPPTLVQDEVETVAAILRCSQCSSCHRVIYSVFRLFKPSKPLRQVRKTKHVLSATATTELLSSLFFHTLDAPMLLAFAVTVLLRLCYKHSTAEVFCGAFMRRHAVPILTTIDEIPADADARTNSQ